MLKRPTFNFDKDLFKRSVEYNVRTMYRRTMKDATDQQVFQASAMALKDQIIDCWMRTQKVFDDKDPKQVVYLSMEFLMGRASSSTRSRMKSPMRRSATAVWEGLPRASLIPSRP